MIPRSRYKDGSVQEAISEGYDVIQLKYDGNFCWCQSIDNVQRYYSDTNRLFAETTLDCPNGVYIGEFMRGTQWSARFKDQFFLFDRLHPNPSASFRDRYSALRALYEGKLLPKDWKLVQNMPMRDRDNYWNQFIEKQGFEGLVYRRSSDPISGLILRDKKTFTLDGRVVGFIAGEGKHEGRLGSLKVELPTGVIVTVGGGWDDVERQYIWDNMDRYQGKWLELLTNAIFESGNVRHARFIRWRPDKDTISGESSPPDAPPPSEPSPA